jgi:hypothetical protein
MLSRNMIARAAGAAPRNAVRALSTTAAQQSKTPSMGDINPNAKSIEKFNQKQKQFRQQLVDAQKERDARAFEAKSPQAPTSATDLNQSASTDGAGSTAEHKQPEPKKSGPLTNLIYGTKEGREMEAQLEASFSQVLARGKYVHSIVHHEVKPDKVDEYVALVGQWYPKIANTPENKVHLVCSMRSEVGDCDTFGKRNPRTQCGFFSNNRQCISGSIRSTKDTTSHVTTFRITPNLPRLIISLRLSWCQRRFR